MLFSGQEHGLEAADSGTFLIVTGIVGVRDPALPRWLAIVFDVLSLTGFAGPIRAGLWILFTIILLACRAGKDAKRREFPGIGRHRAA